MATQANEMNRDLFEYTSGRWIYNESLRLAERSLAFNVQELKRLAAASVNRHESDIKSFKKLAEGGFNRVFEVTMKGDDTQILARLPYHSTVPRRLAVASEVATLGLLHCHDIPVPRVLGYSADPDNSVGAEYILMDRVDGTLIGDSWYTLSDKQRLKVLMGLVQLEARLFAIQLPAAGSIYYRRDLPSNLKKAAVYLSRGADAPEVPEICVGPDVSLAWWHAERSLLSDINRGPHPDAVQCMEAVAKKELAWLKLHAKPRYPFERAYREATSYRKSAPEEYVETLEKYLKIAPFLIPKDKSLHRPILRHPDLQPNNIFVNRDFDIVGLIDWQHCSALPLFLAAGIPKYIQNYQDEESLRFIPPKLPDNLDEMGPYERSAALEQFRRRHLHFYYLGFTQRFNPCHFNALDSDPSQRLKQKTYTHASYPWEGNNAQLKADLIRVTQNWNTIVTCGDNQRVGNGSECIPQCPVTFNPVEAQEVLGIEKEYEDMDTELSRIRDAIGVSVDGWTSNETFDDSVAREKVFKDMAIASVSDSKYDQEMTEKHWPFDDFDENE
ncbi:protein kinase subdomain-containing protein [Nannizzia gypsea CBS 118893]|uniref:Protein kinase subdomain-containing protein n=1 Tax=Arthroderma gypseum (strain ATCC MYA-4604 / CBS 118893) TaxID=535722 RepID=E4UR65_ARTGP|nr:protein kinase subdomain-containing protein [Nannizzia gypsea CBS 118893]EFQ99340.1 protein kinase subdomain-containing protein [Nannizzia gypsea CBS 118893]